MNLELKVPTDFCLGDLAALIKVKTGRDWPYFRLLSQSLDARKKNNIHYLLRLELSQKPFVKEAAMTFPAIKTEKKAVVVGMGPAGYFAALVLSQAGFVVTVIEKGKAVEDRATDISALEGKGILNEGSNYLFGEGGAGTFSDGKLTSRTKTIRSEKAFILQTYVDAGAPEEILYLAKPHIGSDRLRAMMPSLRKKLHDRGCTIQFSTRFEGFTRKNGLFIVSLSSGEQLHCDYLVLATGHSSFDTFRKLISSGIPFRTKPFALGVRVEHPQELINIAQWKKPLLPGVKAAEYRLSYAGDDGAKVYSFCMCPGGSIVPAFRSAVHTGVNGASLYARDGKFANAAIVAAFRLEDLLKREVRAYEVLDYLDRHMQGLYGLSNSYQMPANSIEAFLQKKVKLNQYESSYSLGLFANDFESLFEKRVMDHLRSGMNYFCKLIKGFEKGVIVGTETTSSAPVQVIRNRCGGVESEEGLYIVGEGSGFSGGIISSAADGIKAACDIIERNS